MTAESNLMDGFYPRRALPCVATVLRDVTDHPLSDCLVVFKIVPTGSHSAKFVPGRSNRIDSAAS